MDETNVQQGDGSNESLEGTLRDTEGVAKHNSRGPKKSPLGPILGSVLLFIVLVIGALYIYGAQLKNSEELKGALGTNPELPHSTEVNESNDLDTLEEELKALGAFEDIGAELESGLSAEFDN